MSFFFIFLLFLILAAFAFFYYRRGFGRGSDLPLPSSASEIYGTDESNNPAVILSASSPGLISLFLRDSETERGRRTVRPDIPIPRPERNAAADWYRETEKAKKQTAPVIKNYASVSKNRRNDFLVNPVPKTGTSRVRFGDGRNSLVSVFPPETFSLPPLKKSESKITLKNEHET